MMTKKRYTIYLSETLARKFEPVARRRRGAKSAIVEEALRVRLEPPRHPRIDEGVVAQRINDLSKRMATVGRDAGILAETFALFVRYFLTITPGLPESDQESARLLGKERFEVFVAQVGQRLAGNVRLASEVLETIAVHQSDRPGRKPNGS
jgi:predicted transcriptional regulator